VPHASATQPPGRIARCVVVTPPPKTVVYLLRNAIAGNMYDIPAALLEVTDSTVRCTLTDTAGYSDWLARRLDIPDLKARLTAGEQVTVFRFPRTGYRIKWFKISLGTAFKIGEGDSPDWVVDLIDPRKRGPAEAVVVGGEVAVDSGAIGAVGDAAVLAADALSLVGYSHSLGGDARKQWHQALDPTGHYVPSSSQPPETTVAAPQQTPSTLPPPAWHPDPAHPPAGWYPDPLDTRRHRYWDGAQWTSSF
jgi:hypothetical protein